MLVSMPTGRSADTLNHTCPAFPPPGRPGGCEGCQAAFALVERFAAEAARLARLADAIEARLAGAVGESLATRGQAG